MKSKVVAIGPACMVAHGAANSSGVTFEFGLARRISRSPSRLAVVVAI
jgi:hypothetical protein